MVLIVLFGVAIHSAYMGSKVTVSLYALELGASPFTVGALASFYALAPLLLGVYTGRLADRRGMRLPLLGGSIMVTAAMVTGFLWRDLPGLFAVATLVGTGFVFFNVCLQTLAGSVGRPEHRARNFAWLTIGYSFSTLIGPVLAGFSIDYAGHPLTFLLLSFFPLFPIAVLTFKPQVAHAPRPPATSKKRNTLDLLHDATLRRLIIISGLSVASMELFAFYVPVYAHQIGHSASTIGLILGSFAAAVVLTRFVLGRLVARFTNEQIMSFSLLVAAAAFVVFPFLRDAYALMGIAFVIGLGVGATQPLLMTVVYERSPPGRAGEVTGLRLTLNNIARISMPLVAGALGAAFGASPVFWLNAINLAVLSFLSRR